MVRLDVASSNVRGGFFPNIGSTGSDAGRYQGAIAEKAVPFPSVACRSKAFQKRRVFPTYARNTGTPCRCSPAAAAHGAISLERHPRMPTSAPSDISHRKHTGPSRFPAKVKYGVDSIECGERSAWRQPQNTFAPALHQPALVHRRADEGGKKRVRLERPRLELGMELHADEPGMILIFDHLGQ